MVLLVDGLLCIGDAVHVMLFIGGVGINLVVVDYWVCWIVFGEYFDVHFYRGVVGFDDFGIKVDDIVD